MARMHWLKIAALVMLHLGAFAAPMTFSWSALAIFLGMYWLTGPIGVCLGYHRQLTHRSFSTYPFVRRTLAMLGGLSGQGSAIQWVANHRMHHAFSDTEHDPHSPQHGLLWSHMLWFIPNRGDKYYTDVARRYASDISRDHVMQVLHWLTVPLQVALSVVLLCAGWSVGGPQLAFSWLVWGVCLRLVWVFHVTWCVNSASHKWGYRNYNTTDDSHNVWWVGLLAAGEGWHNNHHAFQRMAKHGHKWWELDITYLVICAMEKMGLAWNVIHELRANSGRRA